MISKGTAAKQIIGDIRVWDGSDKGKTAKCHGASGSKEHELPQGVRRITVSDAHGSRSYCVACATKVLDNVEAVLTSVRSEMTA